MRADAAEPALEAWLAAHPDDADAHLVYADLLQARGDPFGQLMTLSAPGRDPGAALRYQRANRRALYGDLPDDPNALQLEHVFGLPRGAIISSVEGAPAAATWRALAALPAARFLLRLRFRAVWQGGEPNYTPAVEALAQTGAPPRLASLALGDFPDVPLSTVALGDLAPLWPRLGGLRALHLVGTELRLGAVDLPSLVTLEIKCAGLSAESARAVASARWPALESLTLHLGARAWGATVETRDLAPLLSGEHLPRLTTLHLADAPDGDALCLALARAPLVARLRHLGLRGGVITAVGARALLSHRDALAHLESLDLSACYLDHAAELAVRSLCPTVDVGRQRVLPDDREARVPEIAEYWDI